MIGSKTFLLTMVAFFLTCTLSIGAEWYVDRNAPGPLHDGKTLLTAFLTIQEGIDAAQNGDAVWVNKAIYDGPGDFDLSFAGKAITVSSLKGVNTVVIDCAGLGPAVTFDKGEGTDSVFCGFTIVGAGNAEGAVICRSASPTIADNVITGAVATEAAVSCFQAAPVITRNTIYGCTGSEAGAIWMSECNLQHVMVTSNMIYGNESSKDGGAITMVNSTPVLVNNTFVGNKALIEGGALHLTDSTATVVNTIFWKNDAPLGKEGALRGSIGSSVLDISYSDVEGGQASFDVDGASILNYGGSMIDADPLFVDAAGDDYHITFDSPCRSGGDRNCPDLPPYDFEKDVIISLFVFPEIGADEFSAHFYVKGKVAAGETVRGVIVGWPNTSPVMLITGSYIRRDPMPTPYGDFWLGPPWDHRVHFLPIPANGVRVIERVVSTTLPYGAEIPVQALVGTELSNLYVIVVR